jgi:hypothetical protein
MKIKFVLTPTGSSFNQFALLTRFKSGVTIEIVGKRADMVHSPPVPGLH